MQIFWPGSENFHENEENAPMGAMINYYFPQNNTKAENKSTKIHISGMQIKRRHFLCRLWAHRSENRFRFRSNVGRGGFRTSPRRGRQSLEGGAYPRF